MAQAQIDQMTKPKRQQVLPELKKGNKYPVTVAPNGKRVFLSQSSAKPTERRYGVPTFDKKRTTLKSLRGCFAGWKEVVDYLAAKKSSGELTSEQHGKIIDDVTAYMNMQDVKPAHPALVSEAQLDVYAEFVPEKPKKKEKSAAPKKEKSSSGAFVVIGSDVAMEDIDPESGSLTKFKSISQAVFNDTVGLHRFELIVAPSEGVALLKKLENPSAAAVKQISKVVGCPAEQWQLDKNSARDGKYSVITRISHLKTLRKEKQKKLEEKTKKSKKQEKVAAARDIKPVGI